MTASTDERASLLRAVGSRSIPPASAGRHPAKD
jgi:hypothetical protein